MAGWSGWYRRNATEGAKLMTDYALRYWATHPSQELALIPKRVSYLYGRAFPIPANHLLRLTFGQQTLGGPELDPIVSTVADAYLRAVLCLALVGFRSRSAGRRRPRTSSR